MKDELRWAAAAAAMGAGLAALSSCTVPIDGVAGVTVDGSGRLMGVVASCEHRINAAVMYQTNGTSPENEGPTLGTWDLHGDATRSALTWPLNGVSTVVATATMEPDELPGRRRISVYGATHDNSYSTGDVTFRLSETEQLQPGQILMWDQASAESERERNKVVSMREFRRAACDD